MAISMKTLLACDQIDDYAKDSGQGFFTLLFCVTLNFD